jgi:hypothetical protein
VQLCGAPPLSWHSARTAALLSQRVAPAALAKVRATCAHPLPFSSVRCRDWLPSHSGIRLRRDMSRSQEEQQHGCTQSRPKLPLTRGVYSQGRLHALRSHARPRNPLKPSTRPTKGTVRPANGRVCSFRIHEAVHEESETAFFPGTSGCLGQRCLMPGPVFTSLSSAPDADSPTTPFPNCPAAQNVVHTDACSSLHVSLQGTPRTQKKGCSKPSPQSACMARGMDKHCQTGHAEGDGDSLQKSEIRNTGIRKRMTWIAWEGGRASRAPARRSGSAGGVSAPPVAVLSRVQRPSWPGCDSWDALRSAARGAPASPWLLRGALARTPAWAAGSLSEAAPANMRSNAQTRQSSEEFRRQMYTPSQAHGAVSCKCARAVLDQPAPCV